MLRLIYGRAGSGKTSYCFNEIKNKINIDKKIYIITPEQFSFSAEKHLLDTLKENAVIKAEVLTFDRMAYRVFTEVGGLTDIAISESTKAMIIYDILEKNKDKLTFLGKSNKNIDVVSRIFTELNKHKIEEEQIENAIKDTQDIYLKKKLEDILLLRKSFKETLSDNYIESSSKLTILAQKLEYSNMFDDTEIYLDEFAGFTKQEYEIIGILLKKAKNVNITICTDCIEEKEANEADLFYANKQTAIKLIDLAKKNNIKIATQVHLEKQNRFKNRELSFLEENIYRIDSKKFNGEVKNINLFLAMNPYSEIEHLAETIIHLVREENYRYRDIAVITNNIENYSAIIKAIFSQYDIPVFMDKKRDLSNNVLVQFLLSIFEIFAKNWSYETVFAYLKTGLMDFSKNDIYKLENYCLSYGIKGNKWYKDDWNYGNLDKEQIEEINRLRKIVVEPLIKLKNNINNNRNVKEISAQIFYFLRDYGIIERIETKIEDLKTSGKIEIANDYETSIKIVIEVLDEMVNTFGDKKVTFEKYREYFKIAIENKELGAIPGVQDEIIIGNVDRSRSHKVKVIFILGLNDGIFPSINKDEGFINDKDREILKSSSIELAKGTIEKIYDEKFNIYKAFSTAEEKMYLSYTSTDNEGKAIRPSVILLNIKKMFPKLIEKSDIITSKKDITVIKPTFNNLLEKIYKQKMGENIEPIWKNVFAFYQANTEWKEKLDNALEGIDYTNLPEKINTDNIKNLYGNTFKTSISKLEQYRKCPFSFHLKYGLKLKEPITPYVLPIDTGSFMHDVIDTFFEQIKEDDILLENLTKEELEKRVSTIIDKKLEISKYTKLSSSPKFITLTRRLKKVILKSMEYIIQQLVYSDFNVLGTEIEFKNGGNYPPIVLQLENKQKIEIEGKIDRVDLAMGEKGKYLRIVDYKSSTKNINLNEVLYGTQIQLLIYLNEMTINENANSAGILYFNLVDFMLSANKNLTNEELEQELKKRYKMKGIILDDIKVIKMMDTKLDSGFSDLIPVYLDKDGNVSQKRSSTISKENFENLQKQVIKTVKDISNQILNGDISLKPYYDKNKKTPCEYCQYHSICNFNTKNKGNSYFYIPNLSNEEIFEKIKENKDVR